MMSTDLSEINAVLKRAEEHDAGAKSSVLRAVLSSLRQRATMLQEQKKLREHRLRGDPPVYRERAPRAGGGQSVVDSLGKDAERRMAEADERRKRFHE